MVSVGAVFVVPPPLAGNMVPCFFDFRPTLGDEMIITLEIITLVQGWFDIAVLYVADNDVQVQAMRS